MDMNQDMDLDQALNTHFAGRVVRKDLTKLIKEGANVPVYVLEYLLGMYCATDDPEVIEQGLINVKTVTRRPSATWESKMPRLAMASSRRTRNYWLAESG